MSVKLVDKEFSRVGRKTKNADGTEAEDKYSAKQVESIDTSSVENAVTDALEVCGGDAEKFAEYFISGANHHMRLEAGGYDEWQKAARKLMASNLPFLKGKSLDDIVTFLKSQAA